MVFFMDDQSEPATKTKQSLSKKAAPKKVASKKAKKKAATQSGHEPEKFDRRQIERLLESVLESYPDTGHEKISLFAARCALRIFPFLFNPANQLTKRLDTLEKIKLVFVTWRALISAWRFEQEILQNVSNSLFT